MIKTDDLEQPKKKVAIYIRVSTKEQEEMFWEDLQMSKIMSYVDVREKDLELAWEEYIYKDLAVSGADPIDERPWFGQLLDDLKFAEEEHLPFDVVIVYKIDRFARKLSVLLDVVDQLWLYDVWFISTQESIDTWSAFGNAMLGMLWVFAELERDMIQERTLSGRIEMLKAWWRVQNKYWYTRDEKTNRPSINPKEAKIVEEIFDMFVYERKSIADITRELTERRVLIPRISTKNDGKDAQKIKDPYLRRTKTVKDKLRDETYIWKYYYGKSKTIIDKKTWKKKQHKIPKSDRILSEIEHAPIIDKEVFFKAQELLVNRRKKYNNTDQTYLLTGLLKCDCCKHMRARWMSHRTWVHNNKRYYYQCWGKNKQKHGDRLCTTIPLNKEDLETLVLHYIKKLFADPQILTKYLKQTGHYQKNKLAKQKVLEKTIETLNQLRQWQKNLKDLFVFWDLEQTDYKKKRDELEEKVRKASKKKMQLEREISKLVDQKRYHKSFKLINGLLKGRMEEIFADAKKTKKLLDHIIEEIIIYSRDREEWDIVAGRKKKNQKLPYELLIKFRLPQEFLNDISKTFLPEDRDQPRWDVTWREKSIGRYKAMLDLLKQEKVLRSENTITYETSSSPIGSFEPSIDSKAS